ncbi:hypothetical protein GA0070616_4406 [Micromonospora nigra]|uniref:Uncharacterized protein n=1 Tax=Micromonospora nigra TaxID=145857 RepID=A0A1C6SRJ8_9ACTN|nr:hypothetical protein [Micromonospora nigra]SCL32201.1 hypothetical protein GA0070616_4406 [Micromonospora nigra]
MKIHYEAWTPGPDARVDIRRAEAICSEYATQGFDLTLRQLYYQFVARDWIPNTVQSYKRIGSIINKARMAGLLDWSYIVDRTRSVAANSHWETPADIMRSAAHSFGIDKWADQPRRVEVWVEKEALAGIVGQIAAQLDVAYFSCRGYVSQSELWRAGRRLGRYLDGGQAITVLHLGDHDPSGIDMTRDIRDRLELFIGEDHGEWALHDEDALTEPDGLPNLEVRRIALNFDQVRQYNPPPNPAKETDSRSGGYKAKFGSQSWELDALDPTTLAGLIRQHVEGIRDDERYAVQVAAERRHRELLTEASSRWQDVAAFLGGAA